MNWGKLPKKIAAGILGVALILNFSAVQAEETAPKNSAEVTTNESAKPERKIVINSASRLLTLYEGNKKLAMYPLGLGKTSTPTPTGYYKILEKATNPTWIDPSDPEYEVPSGPNNPLGYRWMQIQGNYGIHGTNKPDSIGYYVSNGCIRMNEKDVEELYDAVEVNTPVEITYNRIVVEKAPDDNVVYYIYPDGYGWQTVEVADVIKWLEPYGVAPFVSDSEIAEKIQVSDGEPSYIGKPYNIELNGQRLPQIELNGRVFLSRAVIRDTITYLPVVPIAVALNTKIEWRASESTLKTAYGEVMGYEFKKHQESAAQRGISREKFIDEYNNPDHLRPELPSSNRSHKGENRKILMINLRRINLLTSLLFRRQIINRMNSLNLLPILNLLKSLKLVLKILLAMNLLSKWIDLLRIKNLELHAAVLLRI